MNNLTLSNNFGYTFIYNGERSIHIKDKFERDLGEASYICLNDLQPSELESLEASNQVDREKLVTQFLQNRFLVLGQSTLYDQKKTFQIQCYTVEDKNFVVFSPYGLQGGVKYKVAAVALGVIKITAGLVIPAAAATATVLTAGGAAPVLIPTLGIFWNK